MDTLFSAKISGGGGSCVVQVGGDVDLAVSEQVAEVGRLAACSPAARSFVVDLAGLGFIDLSGFRALMKVRAAALDAGKGFTLQNVPVRMGRLMKLVGLNSLLAAA